MSDFCFICHCPTTISDIQTHFCTESATISGKSILNIANDILALSDIDVTSITCQLCFEIVDEIDAFDHSLAQAKKKLQDRYQPKLREDIFDKKCVISYSKQVPTFLLKTNKICPYALGFMLCFFQSQ